MNTDFNDICSEDNISDQYQFIRRSGKWKKEKH